MKYLQIEEAVESQESRVKLGNEPIKETEKERPEKKQENESFENQRRNCCRWRVANFEALWEVRGRLELKLLVRRSNTEEVSTCFDGVTEMEVRLA